MAIDYRWTARSAQREIDRMLTLINRDPRLMAQTDSEEHLLETQTNLWNIAKRGKERCRPRKNLTILDYIVNDIRDDLLREANFASKPRCHICGRWLARILDANTGILQGLRCVRIVLDEGIYEHL